MSTQRTIIVPHIEILIFYYLAEVVKLIFLIHLNP